MSFCFKLAKTCDQQLSPVTHSLPFGLVVPVGLVVLVVVSRFCFEPEKCCYSPLTIFPVTQPKEGTLLMQILPDEDQRLFSTSSFVPQIVGGGTTLRPCYHNWAKKHDMRHEDEGKRRERKMNI